MGLGSTISDPNLLESPTLPQKHKARQKPISELLKGKFGTKSRCPAAINSFNVELAKIGLCDILYQNRPLIIQTNVYTVITDTTFNTGISIAINTAITAIDKQWILT